MIAIFRNEIHPAGGIESWVYYLAKIYGKTHDIVFYYGFANPKQLQRLRKLIRCVKYEGQVVDCDTAIYCYDFMGIKNTNANRYIHVVHADYKQVNLATKMPEKITEVYGVSQIACDSFKEVTGFDCELLYNPILVDKPSKMLRLISATRLSEEKGLWRIKELAAALDRRGINYQWDIFTPNPKTIDSDNVTFRKQRLDVTNYMADADYLVQLSDTESYCYALVESLSLGTPVITTNLPVLEELKIDDKVAVIIDMKDKDYDKYVDEILDKRGRIKYEPPASRYDLIMGEPTGNEYRYESTLVESVRPGRVLFVDEDIEAKLGDRFYVDDPYRLEKLVKNNYVKVVEEQNEAI